VVLGTLAIEEKTREGEKRRGKKGAPQLHSGLAEGEQAS